MCISDINECGDLSTCGETEQCTNTVGSYVCSCTVGYTETVNGVCTGKALFSL